MKKRRVFYKRKADLNGLFRTGKEQYLSTVFTLNKITLARFVFFNQPLSTRPGLWAYAKSVLDNTPIEVAMTSLTKQDFLVYDAIDRFNNGGPTSFTVIQNESDFYRAINGMIDIYEEVKEITELATPPQPVYVDDMGNPIPPEQLKDIPQPTEEEINISFQ